MSATLGRPLAVLAVLIAWTVTAAPAPLTPVPAAAGPVEIDGKTAFAHDGNAKKPLAVTVPRPKGAYFLTAEAVLPGAGASVAVGFEAADARAAPAVRAAVDEEGKTVRGGKADPAWERTDPAAPVPVRVLVLPGAAEVSVGRSHAAAEPPAPGAGLRFTLVGRASVRNVRVQPLPAGAYLPLVSWLENGNTAVAGKDAPVGQLDPAALPKGWVTSNGGPF